jgi:hypothetical protein
MDQHSLIGVEVLHSLIGVQVQSTRTVQVIE